MRCSKAVSQQLLMKEHQEKEECTFRPATNKSSALYNYNNDYGNREAFYSRLHKESES